jgi:class 3 adenylate cyclase
LFVIGFTALNERLAQLEGGEGPERVTKHLNAYFGALIKMIHNFGGDVMKFAG